MAVGDLALGQVIELVDEFGADPLGYRAQRQNILDMRLQLVRHFSLQEQSAHEGVRFWVHRSFVGSG